jgi:hypothetical protein
MQRPNKEEWLSWKEHPVTESFFKSILEKREDLLEVLAYGSLDSEKQQDRLVGRIAAMTDVLNVTFEE